MKKFFLLLIICSITLSPLFSKGQNDTIDLLPFARIVVPSSQFKQAANHLSKGMVTYSKLHCIENPMIELKLRIVESNDTSLTNHVLADNMSKIQSDEIGLETTFGLDTLGPNAIMITIRMKSNECSKDQEFAMFFANGVELYQGYIKLANNRILEIEPDLDGPDFEGLKKMSKYIRFIAEHSIFPSAEEADKLAHYPFSNTYYTNQIAAIEKEITAEEREKIIQKMNCLDEREIKYQIQMAAGIKTADSLFALKSRQSIEDYYVKYTYQSEQSKRIEPINFAYHSGYTFQEHLRLLDDYDNKVYPLEDYLFAIGNIPVKNDIFRLNQLNNRSVVSGGQMIKKMDPDWDPYGEYAYISAYSENNSSVDFNSKTFFKALSKNVFADSIQVFNYSTHQITNGIWMTIHSAKTQNRSILFQLVDGKWNHQLIQLPENMDSEAKWDLHDLSNEKITILQRENSDNFYIKHNTQIAAPWLQIKTHVADTTRYLVQYKNQNVYDDYDQDDELVAHWTLVKERGYFKSLMANMAKDARPKEDFDYEYDPSDFFEVTPGNLVGKKSCAIRLESELMPNDKLYTSTIKANDLNGDGTREIYHYSLSNGKLVAVEMFREMPDGIIPVKKSVAKKLLMKNNDFRNRLIDSLKGNYEGYKFLKKE